MARYRRTTAKACSRFGQERTRHAPKGRGCVRRIRVKAHAKGTRKISPSVDSLALLGIQLSPRFDRRPTARPPYLSPLLFSSQHLSISAFQHFSISAFQHLSFYLTPCQTTAVRETHSPIRAGNGKILNRRSQRKLRGFARFCRRAWHVKAWLFDPSIWPPPFAPVQKSSSPTTTAIPHPPARSSLPISAFQHFSFYQKSPLAKRQPRGKPLVRDEIHDLLPRFQLPLHRKRTQHLLLRNPLPAFCQDLLPGLVFLFRTAVARR